MNKLNQHGEVNAILISLIMAVVFLFAAIGFGAWAFTSRQDYKSNTDAKISDAVVIAKQQESTAKDKQFVEREKNPLRTYTGPDAYGGISVMYPKTWSAYVSDNASGSDPVDGYFHPATVPSAVDGKSVFALRVKVLNQTYAEAVQQLDSSQSEGKLKITAYSLPKVPGVVGIKASGTLPDEKEGTVVLLPLRSSTLQISSEGTQYQTDFDKIILPNFNFSK